MDSTNLYSYGGGITCWEASPRIVRNIIRNNSANGGGAILSVGGTPQIQDNWIYNNTASFAGAAYLSDQGRFLNNTLWGNTPDNLYVDTTGLVANNIIANSGPATGVTAYGTPDTLSWFQYNDVWEPAGTEILLVIQSDTNWGTVPISLAGTNGNLAVDPLFTNATNFDLNLSAASPCINAGDLLGLRSTNEVDIAGGTRIFALRVDMGASEFRGARNYPPLANAGPDQAVFWSPGQIVTLDGSASIDPESAPLTFDWRQTAGPPVMLLVTNPQAFFTPPAQGDYRFDLIVNDGVYDSPPDAVRIVVSNLPPIASAGPDQIIPWQAGQIVTMNGSASMDPEGVPLTFDWRQTAGPVVTLLVTNHQAFFTPPVPGEYQFELVVNDGLNDSTPDAVRIVVTNLPPIASAGLGQSLPAVPEVLVLDGSHSLDPEGRPLTYHWRQTAGPSVLLTAPRSPRPVIRPPAPGMYEFELTVKDGFNSSPPDSVKFYLGQCLPVANAGPTRYAGRDQITLDGSGSFAPNSSAPLKYAWRVVSGPTLYLTPINVVNPVVGGFTQVATNREAVFELVVSAGGLTSVPSTVKMIIVPSWNNVFKGGITNVNPPFNPNRPTIFGFRGGDCSTGGVQTYPADWFSMANLFAGHYGPDSTSPPSGPRYFGYGDQFIVLLSALAPDYDQPIQTTGYSTGGMPACDAAERLNISYKDPRYLVNRITLIDAGCRWEGYDLNISNLASNRMPGKMFWIDNYYAAGSFHPGALNVQFPVPPADHGTPQQWYFRSWTVGDPYRETNFNHGVFGGAFFSVVGPGRNYQLETGQSEYYFGWNPPPTATFPLNNLVQMSPALYPARLPGVVELDGPTNGILAAERSVVFSCQPVLNAVTYQILVGPDARRVDQVVWEGPVPPTQALPGLPFARTWWKIRVADAYGTTSWSDPRYVLRDSDADGLSDEAEVLTYHTDPDKADPVLLTSPSVSANGDFSLTISNALGRDVVVQASTNLANWVAITNFLNLQQTIQITDTATPKPPARFYRAVVGQ